MIKVWKIKTIKKLINLCCDYIFTEEFDNDAFCEIACRYLCKLGVVQNCDNELWIYDTRS